jgi:hypothetical protein
MQPTGCPRLRTDHLRNVSRNRRLLGDNDYGHGSVPGDVTKTNGQKSIVQGCSLKRQGVIPDTADGDTSDDTSIDTVATG